MDQDTPPSSIALALATASTPPPVRRGARRWRIVAPLVAVIAVALAAAACAPPGSPGSGRTGDMVQAINQDRAAAGLAPLAWDSGLYTLAQNHSGAIAASGSLWHSDLAGLINAPFMAGWYSLGENLLMAPAGMSTAAAEDQWMNSGPHRANILNGGFNRIGVGVTTDGAGRTWMVALFGTR